jgi:hypothetical protein
VNEAKKEERNSAPHVSEEAAQMADITGSTGPDLEQGTPVQDVGIEETKDLRQCKPLTAC